MNIKNLYPFSGITAVLCVVARYLQITLGTDERGLPVHGSVFSWLIIPLLAVSVILIFVMACNCYGVTKLTEIEVPAFLCPVSILLGILTAASGLVEFSGTNTGVPSLNTAEAVLSVLSAAGFILLGIAVVTNISKNCLFTLFFPVILFCVKLINLFLSNIAITNNSSLSLKLIKMIFVILFLLYMPIYFFNPQFDKKTPTVLFYGFSSSIIVFTDIIPRAVTGDIDISLITDAVYVVYSLVFVSGLIKSIIKKSELLKLKTTEEQ